MPAFVKNLLALPPRTKAILAVSAVAIACAVAVAGCGLGAGKSTSGATPGVVLVMLETVREHLWRTGKVVGVKAAGGVSNTKAALHMLVLVKETLGDDWLTPERFRIGASSLLNDLLMQYAKLDGGHYGRAEDFSKE